MQHQNELEMLFKQETKQLLCLTICLLLQNTRLKNLKVIMYKTNFYNFIIYLKVD